MNTKENDNSMGINAYLQNRFYLLHLNLEPQTPSPVKKQCWDHTDTHDKSYPNPRTRGNTDLCEHGWKPIGSR